MAQEYIHADVALPLEVLEIDAVCGLEDPAVPQCAAPGPMDVGVGLPGEVAQLGLLASNDVLPLLDRVDWLPAQWRIGRQMIQGTLQLP